MDASIVSAAITSAGATALLVLILWPKSQKPAITFTPAATTPSNPSPAITGHNHASLSVDIVKLSSESEFHFLSSDTCPIQYDIPTTLQIGEIKSPLFGSGRNRKISGGDGFLPESIYNASGNYVLSQQCFSATESGPEFCQRFLTSAPRKNIIRNPQDVKACIVTCGGLCPGLNVVIRELVMTLTYNYGTTEIYGIKDGYMGFYSPNSIIKLVAHNLADIHTLGGTFLRTSRGGWDLKQIADSIEEHGFNQVYIIGGDGTHRGIMALVKEFEQRNSPIAIVGIPKTIDNDIPVIDRSFGFDTSVEEAQRAINSANVEANSALNGVGLVKLSGRNSGFIALHSALANRDVNLCLIPEAPYELNGDSGIYNYIYRRLETKQHAVVVVAEGAADGCTDEKLVATGTDASGNPALYDIGTHMKKGIVNYCKAKGMEITLKYIDPTYMIRTVPAQASDKILSATLAQAAVHGAFAGFTGFSSGIVGGQACFIPIRTITSKKEGHNAKPGQRRVNPPTSPEWWRLVASTGQPVY